MSKHLCPWPECTYDIDPRLGVCYYHWTQLPKPYREALTSTYNPDWSVQPAAHRAAVAQALQWIKDKIEEPPTVKRISRSAPVTVKRIPRSR